MSGARALRPDAARTPSRWRAAGRRAGSFFLAFLAAVVTTAIVGSIVQTQVSLAAITGLGVPVTVAIRAATTGQDLVTFGPVMAAIAGAALLPGLAAAHVLVAVLPRAWRPMVFALAGAAALWTAFKVMGFVTPMPNLVAAVRGPIGLSLMCLTGMPGGWAYARLTRPVEHGA